MGIKEWKENREISRNMQKIQKELKADGYDVHLDKEAGLFDLFIEKKDLPQGMLPKLQAEIKNNSHGRINVNRTTHAIESARSDFESKGYDVKMDNNFTNITLSSKGNGSPLPYSKHIIHLLNAVHAVNPGDPKIIIQTPDIQKDNLDKFGKLLGKYSDMLPKDALKIGRFKKANMGDPVYQQGIKPADKGSGGSYVSGSPGDIVEFLTELALNIGSAAIDSVKNRNPPGGASYQDKQQFKKNFGGTVPDITIQSTFVDDNNEKKPFNYTIGDLISKAKGLYITKTAKGKY